MQEAKEHLKKVRILLEIDNLNYLNNNNKTLSYFINRILNIIKQKDEPNEDIFEKIQECFKKHQREKL